MNKTMHTIIKSSLVTAGLLGAVTLNAWWCHHCRRDHHGRVCPITGNTQYGCGPAYGCWESDVDSDDEDNFVQEMARRRRARVQGREDKIFSHLRRHGSVAELNQFVRKTQELVENRGYRMVVGADGFFQVIPQGPLPHGFRLDVVRGHGVPPPPLHPFLGCDFDFGRPFLPFGCEDAFDAFGCHEDFGSQFLPYGCHPHGHYGCEHFVPYGCYPHYDCHYGCEDDF